MARKRQLEYIKYGRYKYTEEEIEIMNKELVILIDNLRRYHEENKLFTLIEYHVDCGIKTDYLTLVRYSKYVAMYDNDRELIRCFYSYLRRRNELVVKASIHSERWFIGDREITNDEKDLIIDFMKRHNIPFYIHVYNEIGRRYIEGELDLLE